MEGQYSHGYFPDTLTGELMDFTVMDPSIGWAAGAMVSNIPDLKIYLDALSKGTMISAKSQEERLKFVNTGVVDFVKYGLGIFSMGGFIGHNGGITGYNTTMCYNPGLDAAIIVSVNEFGVNGGKSDAIFAKLADLLFPDKSFFK
ncbi:MAG: serine hydrolase [Ignavibacteria bacterium]|nr:serine hydrolase [Ignavibacteria bacterium]